MATYRKLPSGKIHAQVRRKGCKAISKAFDLRADAERWAQGIERQIQTGSYQDPRAGERMLFESLVDWYIQKILAERGEGVTDTFRLTTLTAYFKGRSVASVNSHEVMDYALDRLKLGKAPATVRRELGQLSDLIKTGMAFKQFTIPANPVPDALAMLRKLRKLPPSKERTRRLREGELERLMAVPMTKRAGLIKDVILFAIEAPMRQGEIAALTRADVDWKRKVYRIQHTKTDWKTGEEGRDMPLTAAAIAILERVCKPEGNVVPLGNGPVFGYDANGIGTAFRYLCRKAGIQDLHFHDLRHEGISRLFEQGYTIEQVSVFSGHRDWASLKRYTQLDAAKIAAGG